MFSSAFVCFLAELCKNYSISFHKIWWKGSAGPWKKLLDFCGNLDHVMLGLWLG